MIYHLGCASKLYLFSCSEGENMSEVDDISLYPTYPPIYHSDPYGFVCSLKSDPASIQNRPQNGGDDEEHGLLRHPCAQHGRLHLLLGYGKCLHLMDIFQNKMNGRQPLSMYKNVKCSHFISY